MKPGIETATPGLHGKRFIYYTTAAPIQEEADTWTMIIIYCLNIRISLPDASTIIVTSTVTRHSCISTSCTTLQGYTLDSFVQHWCEQQNTPTECQQHRSEYWVRYQSAQSYQSYTVLQAVTLPVRLCHRKVTPIKLIDPPSLSKF